MTYVYQLQDLPISHLSSPIRFILLYRVLRLYLESLGGLFGFTFPVLALWVQEAFKLFNPFPLVNFWFHYYGNFYCSGYSFKILATLLVIGIRGGIPFGGISIFYSTKKFTRIRPYWQVFKLPLIIYPGPKVFQGNYRTFVPSEWR